uniref:hypothetical protein n=1 Tax=Mitsuokella multacida TaxID=52226 RepID=UPI0040293C72
MVLSGGASQSLSQEFKPGESVTIGGYAVTYEGQLFAEDGTMKFYRYLVDGSEVRAMTKLHKNGEDAAREPAIAHTLFGDSTSRRRHRRARIAWSSSSSAAAWRWATCSSTATTMSRWKDSRTARRS